MSPLRPYGLYLFTAVLTLSGCIDIIEVDTSSEPSRLVIDGFITSENTVHQVRVVETIEFSNDANTPVSNADVQIIGSDGTVLQLVEGEPGYYHTTCCFSAQQDVAYQVRVVYGGKTIESVPATLPEKIELKSISIKPEIRQLFREIDQSIAPEPGFWVTTPIQVVESDKDYYLWQAVPTYIWEARLARDEANRFCYVTAPYAFQNINIQSELDGGYERELFWVTASRDMELRYSLEVTQFNISEDAFLFWERIKKQQDNVGSIFDTPPSSIQGNLFNPDDPKDIVLGYFGVYELSSQRMFLDLTDLPFNLDLITLCQGTFRGRPPECLDCRKNNRGDASNVKPDWWQDK